MLKRGFAFFLCLALLALLIVPAGAEQGAKFLHPASIVRDSALLLVGAPVGDQGVTVTADTQTVPCTVSTLKASGLPVTYYCIVDQSSSFSISQKQHQLRALKALSNTMRPDDSMVLCLMGEKLAYGEPLTTAAAREKAIEEACVYTAKFTNLDVSILAALEHITTARSSEEISCVLLITDGLDNKHEQVERADVYQAIRSSGLSFFTISLVDPWADNAAQTNAQRMADYAGQSLGGAAYFPSKDYNSPTCVEDVVSQLVERALSASVIRLELSQLPASEQSLALTVTWGQSTDTYTVDAALLPAPTAPTQPETTAPAEPETTAPAEPKTTAPTQPETTAAAEPETAASTQPETTIPTEQESTGMTRPASTPAPTESIQKGRLTLILVVAGFLVVAVLVALALLLWRRQRELEMEEFFRQEDSEDDIPLPQPPQASEDFPNLAELDKLLDFKAEPPKEMPLPQVDIPLQKPAAIHGCQVKLVPELHPEGAIAFVIGVNESVTLGRSQRSDIILNETDRSLSGLHFELQWDSRSLYLRDRTSTNGTAMNGVPLRPEVWVRVEKKAVIQAGSTKYTILTEKK